MIIRHPPIKRHPRCRPFPSPCLILVCALLLLGGLGGPFARFLLASGNPQPSMILAPILNMRSGPGLHHPPIGKLRRGDRVLVLSYEGEWVRILFGDKTGFIMNRDRYIRIGESDAAPQSPPPKQNVQDDDVNRQIEASEEKVASFAKEETAIVDALEETEKALDDARKKVSRLTKELAVVDEQIVELEKNYHEMEEQADTLAQYVADRLVALYKLSWLGKFRVLASSDSIFEFFSRKRSLEQILDHDEALMAKLDADKASMQTLLDQLVERRAEKKTTTADLNDRIDTMIAKQTQREVLLAEIKNKKSLQQAVLASLKASAEELERTMAAFGQKAQQPTSIPAVIAEKPFAELKGLLMMPVKGKIISFFGPFKDQDLNVIHFQSGITIKADRGEPIRAVYSGQTLFSSWFKGFGNMIIIDHGDHYYTVYAHLEELFKSKGDPVEAGEVIATVGDTGSLTGAGLHFEVRHHGKPIDPMSWINKG